MPGPDPSSAEELMIAGAVVGGRYVLVNELGRGASGAVWRATHRLLGSDVAIKFLAVGGTTSNETEFLLERFRFEAQVSARLAKRTDKIVAVQDGGLYGDLPYIVMDLVEGESLEAAVDEHALDALTVARVAEDVAEALEASHAEEIAHRDVKPANILAVRGSNGVRYKLADFGVAKLFGVEAKGLSTPRATAAQTLVGSPAYMSPEAISADRTTSGQGDLWSLAATLYEALTQRIPFNGDAWPAIAVAIMARRYPPPSKVLGPAGARFDAFFAKAFAEKIEDRFASARELAEAFCAAARDEGGIETSARATTDARSKSAASTAKDTFSAVAAPRSQKARRGGLLALAGAAMLALLIGGAALLTRGKKEEGSGTRSHPATPTVPSGARTSPTESPTPPSTAEALASASPPTAPGPEVRAVRSAPAPTVSAAQKIEPTAPTEPTAAPSAAATSVMTPPTPEPRLPPRQIDPSETQ